MVDQTLISRTRYSVRIPLKPSSVRYAIVFVFRTHLHNVPHTLLVLTHVRKWPTGTKLFHSSLGQFLVTLCTCVLTPSATFNNN